MLALGVLHGAVTGEKATRHMKLADELMYTCVQTYRRTSTGIGPECVPLNSVATFQPSLFSHPALTILILSFHTTLPCFEQICQLPQWQ